MPAARPRRRRPGTGPGCGPRRQRRDDLRLAQLLTRRDQRGLGLANVVLTSPGGDHADEERGVVVAHAPQRLALALERRLAGLVSLGLRVTVGLEVVLDRL